MLLHVCRSCMMDFAPRHLQGGMYVLFANIAEIVQVELEREIYLDANDSLQMRSPAFSPIPVTASMRRLSSMFTTPVMSSR